MSFLTVRNVRNMDAFLTARILLTLDPSLVEITAGEAVTDRQTDGQTDGNVGNIYGF